MGTTKTKAVRESRRKVAEERNAKWAVLTPQQQLHELDERLGTMSGACRQRAKLLKKIHQQAKQAEQAAK